MVHREQSKRPQLSDAAEHERPVPPALLCERTDSVAEAIAYSRMVRLVELNSEAWWAAFDVELAQERTSSTRIDIALHAGQVAHRGCEVGEAHSGSLDGANASEIQTGYERPHTRRLAHASD